MEHLELQDILGLAVGEPSSGPKRHLKTCPSCTLKLEAVRKGLASDLKSEQESGYQSCPVFDPEMIASYYEKMLGQEQKKDFEKHMMTCPFCLSAWLALDQDMKKYGPLKKIPKRKSEFRLLTVFLKETGIIIKNFSPFQRFVPVFAPALRAGKKPAALPSGMEVQYGEKNKTARLLIEHRSKNQAQARLETTFGKQVSLQKNGVEIFGSVFTRGGSGKKTRISLGVLQKGSYEIRLDKMKIFAFKIG